MISWILALHTAQASLFPVDQLQKDLGYLTSDACGGRLGLTTGSKNASNYIANELRKAGIKPGGTKGYFDPFQITEGNRATSRSTVTIGTWNLKPGTDFTGLVGADGTVTGSAVFVGFGRDADFEGHSVRGQWVIELRGSAPSEPDETLAERAARAQAKGAAGVIFAGPKWPDGADLVLPTRTQFGADFKIPVLSVSEKVFNHLVNRSLWRDKSDFRPQFRTITEKISATVQLEPNSGEARNVVGLIPGTDPVLKYQIIVIGAHYDHLGMGQFSSMSGHDLMHRGADDNGSGTTGLLALARTLQREHSNKRSIVVQFYSGEELGLLGSAAWVKNHPDTMKQVHAMVNMDMIGRLRNGKLVVFSLGTAKEFDALIKPIQSEGIKPDLLPQSPPNSDHASFAAAGKPVLFFNTDLHSEYHTERDTIDTINFVGMSQVLDYVHQTVKAIDGGPSTLTFVAPVNQGGGDPNTRRRVRTGFIPDMGGSGPGMLLNGASPGSPAAKAGVQAGDRLVRFNNVPVGGIEDLQKALATAQVGVTVKIIVLRNGKEVELEITPEASKG